MRRHLCALVAMMFMAVGATAEELRVANVTIPQNSTATIEIELINPSTVYESFTFQIELPDGIVPVMAANGFPSVNVGTRFTGGMTTGYKTGNIATFARLTDGTTITGTEGVLFSAIIEVDGEVAVGTKLTATVSDITFTTPDLTKETLDPVSFDITIGEPADTRTILDETSTTAPEASDGAVDVRVRRTISADIWNTICLPFAMTEAQTKEAFGDDVQLAAFTDWSSEEDDDENIVGIEISFSTVDVADGIEANTPLLIKVANNVTEFTVDGVVIDPEEEPSVMIKHGTKKRDPESYMIGTYKAGTVLENMSLFLNNNKFWYSTGKTTMKAYRAFFNIYDILTDVEDSYAAVKMAFNLDGFETKVEGIPSTAPKGMIYDLSGRKLSKMSKKGVYIVNGKKEFIK